MKKALSILTFTCLILFRGWSPYTLSAQLITGPDYCYAYVGSNHDNVLADGSAKGYPYDLWSEGPAERTDGLFLAKGFRWWGYTGYWKKPCYDPELFDYPGSHGVFNYEGLACAGTNPPVGYCAGWGSVVVDPEGKRIFCLNGAGSNNGPTTQHCIPNWLGGQICYQPPGIWGKSQSYGYLRKNVVVQSTGLLQPGDPVEIKSTIIKNAVHEGDGFMTSQGVLVVNRLRETILYRWGGREYIDKSGFNDIKDLSLFRDNNLAFLQVEDSETGKDSISTVAVGDTIVLELIFVQSAELENPHSPLDSEGWAGESPEELFSDIYYTRTDSVIKLVRRYGNTLAYDLTCLTTGAVLTPLTPGGPNVDEDEDGISDSREKGTDGNDDNFDGNSDGIPDFKQSNVASFHTYDGLNYVTLSIPAGIELSEMKVTNNPSPSNTPADAEFPWGFFDFSLDGLDQGEAVTVTLILHNGASAGKYYKYGLTPTDNLEPHWYDFTYDGQTGAQINGNVITLHFVDGLRGDEDITANCSIKEPGGPAIGGSTGIHDLSEKTGLVVYPNPACDNITLRLNNILPGNNYLITIFSNTGGIVRQKLIDICDSNEELNISTAELSSGFYLITLSNGNFNYKAKFIKLK